VAEPFKNFINEALIRRGASALAQANAGFDASRFTKVAMRGLDGLELKARAMQVADALEVTLPVEFDSAATWIDAALAPPLDDTDLSHAQGTADGLHGWMLWSVREFIARRGIAHPERALQSLHALTQRFTAEFAIRPFIVAHPELVYRTLRAWTTDRSVHVRRLVSEGSRPRLPWGLQLRSLIADPSPSFPLLLALQDDPSEYVRRSVANHLNDIAKDHPALVAEWLESHLPSASAQRQALLRHASRTLIKRGDARVLRVWGLGQALKGSVSLSITPRRVRVGEHFAMQLTVASSSRRAQKVAIDYVVHHVKADGKTSGKVFKGWQFDLPASSTRVLEKRHSMKRITTRRYYPGKHTVEIQVNGAVVASAFFTLSEA
jgi:3-methyladenine DNA glycosylase AlkC